MNKNEFKQDPTYQGVKRGRTVTPVEFLELLENVNWEGKLLPEGLTISKGIDFTAIETIKSLPNNLTVKGSMILEENKILKTLPKNLKIERNLFLANSRIKSLPVSLKVKERIYFNYNYNYEYENEAY